MKLFFLYLVGFFEKNSMLPKQYPNNCAVDSSNQRSIIIIINDKSIFFANDGHHKVLWTLNHQKVL